MSSRATLLICALVAGVTCAEARPTLQEDRLSHQGRSRTYLHYAPPHPPGQRLPTLFVLHGGGGSAERIARQTGFTALAEREGFQVVYPQGVSKQWNDGRGVPTLRGVDMSGVDDVGFFRALFDRVIAQHDADPARLYVTGLSNGGLMSYRLGIELGDRIAAIAAVIANLPTPLARQTPRAPLPVLIMNGTEDPLMAWDGKSGPQGGKVLSAWQTFQFWIRHNGGQPQLRWRRLPDRDPSDRSRVEVTRAQGLRAPVVLYAIRGGGHTLPGGSGHSNARLARLVGPVNQDIKGIEVIWDFVSRQKR